ncbi:hypothetical protein HG536_0G00500 [Torulaspora globosa]|uniref:Elongation factor 1-gamma 1 n=1 Tax=Torulaspora globosa TaxID=48254 RepID=A0A7G3ZL07_9SACH|nr:uncharacterized protein HG536_0G00500 [Torulaspora globosa]QLL34193.1 hypothetical protein HG536_0G00500 [Torulaspora globosa]
MSVGTLYACRSPRVRLVKALIKYLKLDIEIVNAAESAQFAELFPLKKMPAFVDAKGYKLTETIAIAYYFVSLASDEKAKTTLLGGSAKEKADILRWASVANQEVSSAFMNPLFVLLGRQPYNKKVVESSLAELDLLAQFFEQRLREFTYLAAERITLGDLVGAVAWALPLGMICGPEFRERHPYLTRWFNTVLASPIFKEEYSDFKFAEKTIEAPKKPKAEKPKKDAEPAKPAAKKEEPEDAEPAAPKKPKHPLEALGKSTFVLDEWKRKYSNEDTRSVALPWFWEHYNPEEYSIWKVDYKYNDELTLTFMSNNLVGGFFNRLSASTKYMFGCLVVYGENNNNGITGAMMIRGQDNVPAFDVAPDWESYSYTKLDPSNEQDKEFINNMWAWDKPVIANGESREIVDGKVLK